MMSSSPRRHHDVVAPPVWIVSRHPGNHEVGAIAGGDMGAAGAAERDRGRHVVRNGEVEILVGVHRDVDWAGGRRREDDGVAGPGGVLHRCVHVGEAAVAGRINQQIAAAAVLNDLDVR
jgi:hypothetical protein